MTPELCSKNPEQFPKWEITYSGPDLFTLPTFSAILLNPIAISDIRKSLISLQEIQMSLQEIRELATMFLQEHL